MKTQTDKISEKHWKKSMREINNCKCLHYKRKNINKWLNDTTQGSDDKPKTSLVDTKK